MRNSGALQRRVAARQQRCKNGRPSDWCGWWIASDVNVLVFGRTAPSLQKIPAPRLIRSTSRFIRYGETVASARLR